MVMMGIMLFGSTWRIMTPVLLCPLDLAVST